MRSISITIAIGLFLVAFLIYWWGPREENAYYENVQEKTAQAWVDGYQAVTGQYVSAKDAYKELYNFCALRNRSARTNAFCNTFAILAKHQYDRNDNYNFEGYYRKYRRALDGLRGG